MEAPAEKTSIVNKTKKIDLKSEDNKKFEVEFINEIKSLKIEAKSLNDMLPEIFSNEFTLEDIKKVRFFNDDYESIDDCLSEIFDKLGKNETKMEIKKEGLNIIVPLYSKKYPEIKFLLKKQEKSEDVKYSELFDLVKKMKVEQETEVKALKEKINYLEDLLKIKKEKEKKPVEFDGSIISIKCFGMNEFDEYFDTNLPDKKKHFISFAFPCKDEKNIHLALASFMGEKKEVYGDNADDINCRIKNNKLFIDLIVDKEKKEEKEDLFTDIGEDKKLFNLFLALDQSLTIKTKATPKIFTAEFDLEEFLKIILDTELEFKNMSPQIQLFTYHFLEIIKDIYPINDGFPKSLFTDIFINIMNGKYIYKIPQKLLNEYDDLNSSYGCTANMIFEVFKNVLEDFPKNLYIYRFKDYKILNFDDIDFYILSPVHKVGVHFNFIIPGLNEYFDKIITEKKQ